MDWPIRSVSLGVHGPWLAVFWLALTLALALAVWAYRAPVPPLPRPSRVLFGALRFAALALLILILFQPVVTVASRESERPVLPVLVDVSTSMKLPARAGAADTTTRFHVVRRVLADLLPELAKDFDVRLYGFAEDVEEIARSESGGLPDLVPRGPSTALGPALGEVLGRRAERPSALVLLSDGSANSGSDPVAAAERLAVPIISVPASLDSAVNDVWVAECLVNRNAYLGQEIPVSVTLASQLELPTRVNVVLRQDDHVIASESVTLPSGAGRVPVELRLRPERLGVHRYLAEVEAAPGELTTDNNRRALAINVQEERLQVLVISDVASWDFTFIRRALASDRTLSVTALARLDPKRSEYELQGTGRLRGLPGRAADLAPFDAVVLVDIDPRRLPGGAREALLSFARSGGGFVVVAGSGDAFSGFESPGWSGLLPVRLPARRTGGEFLSMELTPAGRVHPVTSLGEGSSRADDLWRELPPLRVRLRPQVGLAGEMLVIGKGAGDPVPMVAAGRTGGGRVLLVNGALVWRWGFLLPAMSGDDLVHRRFWGEAVRWVAEGKSDGNLELFADQSVFLGGRRVTLGARLIDEQLRPVDDAEVTVEVIPENRGDPLQLKLSSGEGQGQYTGDAGFLSPGLYRLRGSAQRGNRRFAAEGEHFLVDRASIEGTTPAANPDLLRRLAARTNGAYVTPEEAASSIKSIVERRVAAARTVELKLWNHAGMFLAFVGCVSLEWFLRRRRGLA